MDVLRNTSGYLEWCECECGGSAATGAATYIYYTTLDSEHRPDKVYRHLLGTPQSRDECIYREPDALYWLSLGQSSDGRVLFVCSESKETTEIHYILLGEQQQEQEGLRVIRGRERGVRYTVDVWSPPNSNPSEGRLYIITNRDGCLEGKLVTAGFTDTAEWTEVPLVTDIADSTCPLHTPVHVESVLCFQGHIAVTGRYAGLTAVWVCSMGALQSPGPGSEGQYKWVPVRFSESCYSVNVSRNYVYNTDQLR